MGRPPSKNLVTAFEAKTRFVDLLARGEAGESVVITRHGRPVARLVPFSDVVDRAEARLAAARLAAFGSAEGLRLPKGVRARDLIDEGRS